MYYLKKNATIVSTFVLIIICFLLYFTNISNYPFIDTDETKFVSIAKEMLNYNDWVNIKLNGAIVFDVSPLFVWITNLSCIIWGKISTEAVRLPISITTIFGIITLFFVVKKLLRKTYAFIIAIIFATCLGTLIFSRLATNDMLFTIFTMISILFSFRSILATKEQSTTKYWVGTHIFTTFAFLSGGILGLLVPFFSIVAMHIFAGKHRELFNPKYQLIGLLIFLTLCCPWYIVMISKHGLPFIEQNIQAYNFINHISPKKVLNVFGIFALGFSPWIFSFLWVLGKNFKDIVKSVFSYFKENSEEKLKEKWNKLNKIEQFISLNTIVFFTTLVFAILYGYKYTFLILFMMFPASCISGHYWYEYIIKKNHDKSIFFATMIPNIMLIACSIIALLGHNVINKWLFHGLNHLIVPLVILFFIIPLISIFSVMLNGRIAPFVSNLILMISLSFIITPNIFNFITSNGGENDLINFARIANKDNATLSAFIPSKKYSLVYYYDKPITFNNSNDLDLLKNYLKNNPHAYVVVEIKDMWKIEEHKIKYMLLDSGKRYCLIQQAPEGIINQEEEKEPEIIIY